MINNKRFVLSELKNIRSILVLFVLFAILTSCKSTTESTSAQTKKPNIIVVLIDDAGYVDFGFMGSQDLETPNIDKLASQGVILTDGHVSATVCAPSRAGLITGKYQQRFGFEANGTGSKEAGEHGLSDDVKTMADVFKQNDYKTIALGKWHLGFNDSDHPNKRGFDEFYGFIDGSRSYFPIENPLTHKMLQQNGERVIWEGYMTDVLTDRAIGFIDENKENPFLMYLSYNAVHTPMQAKEEHLEKYKEHPRQKLAAMTWSLDENIGRIMAKLESSNALENTLVFFLSDNGGATTNTSLNGPLKGFKGNKFEGGHRVPFVVYWKGQIKGNQTFDGLSSSLDIFKTSMEAAGIKENKELGLDGVNLLPYLKGEKTGDPHEKLFWRKLEKAAVRIGDQKVIRLEEYGSVLYNLKDDLGENNDLSKEDPESLKKLTQELEQWETGVMEPLWTEGEYWKNTNFNTHKDLMLNNYRTLLEQRAFLKKQRALEK